MRQLFTNLFQKWEIVYSTKEIDSYYKAKARLNHQGMAYKTDVFTAESRHRQSNGSVTIYNIKVRKEEVRQSYDVIHGDENDLVH